ncbi:MAG: PQQ-like beta-propeller repeat protein [Fuerstiella sp.]|nr:PQQ-like beta-propeller repeat protein [Fuerstiella sp.]
MRPHYGLLCFALCFVGSFSVQADDWPRFLGPQHKGVSDETNLVGSIPAAGPDVLWRVDLGVGSSGVVVSAGTVYTLFQDDARQYVVALDESSGDLKWKSGIADAYLNPQANGPRSTPTVAGDAVYVMTGEGILVSLDSDSGKIRWSVNTVSDPGMEPAQFGMSSSPLVYNDVVVVQTVSQDGSIAGFSVESGVRKWVAGIPECGYASPALISLCGVRQIVAMTGASVAGIVPHSGELLWEHPFVTDFNCNTANPVQIDESSVLISAGENHGSVLLGVTESDDGWTAEERWSSLGKRSVLRAEWQTPVLLDGHLFGLDNIGAAGPITNLVCVNAATGKSVWSKRRFGKSNLTLADGKLFMVTIDGELVIVNATTDGFRETARTKVLRMTRQAPVIANGRLYLRDDKEVVCIDVLAKS